MSKKPGRKPISTEERVVPVCYSVFESQREYIKNMGGSPFIRELINSARRVLKPNHKEK